MSIKKKSSNSLAKLLEKTKNITSNICVPKYVEQIANEENILRPYLEPDKLSPNYKKETIDHISITYRPHYRPHIGHISATYRTQTRHISTTYRTQYRTQYRAQKTILLKLKKHS